MIGAIYMQDYVENIFPYEEDLIDCMDYVRKKYKEGCYFNTAKQAIIAYKNDTDY